MLPSPLPILIQKAKQTPVSLWDAKDQIRGLEGVSDFDEKIASYIDAATRQVETLLGMSLMRQTWKQSFRSFDCLRLTKRPFVDVVSANYYDADNVQSALSTALFAKVPTFAGAEIILLNGQTWPSTSTRFDAVEFTYTAGHLSPNDVEPDLRTAVLLYVEFLFSPSIDSRTGKPTEPPIAFDQIIEKYSLTVV